MNSHTADIHSSYTKEMLPHIDSLYNYAYRLTNEYNDAKDLLQETYFKAYRFYNKFQQGTNPRAWLFRIMRNSYINNYRKKKRDPIEIEYIDDDYRYKYPETESTDIRELLDQSVLDDDVSTALTSLPEEFRSIILLRDLEEWTYEELAEHFEIPIGTVRSRLHRARKALGLKLYQYASKHNYV